jgi:hypothetical protein
LPVGEICVAPRLALDGVRAAEPTGASVVPDGSGVTMLLDRFGYERAPDAPRPAPTAPRRWTLGLQGPADPSRAKLDVRGFYRAGPDVSGVLRLDLGAGVVERGLAELVSDEGDLFASLTLDAPAAASALELTLETEITRDPGGGEGVLLQIDSLELNFLEDAAR